MSSRPSLKGHLTLHLIMVIFLSFPIWVTSMLPTTWIELERNDGQVNLEAEVCLLIVIPFRTIRIEGLERVETKPGTIRINETEGPDMLVLEGSGGTAELLALQSAAPNLKKRINEYISSSSTSKLSLRTTSHTGISIFCAVWAAFFLSIYAFYLLSWLVPQNMQWAFLDLLLKRLPAGNAFRSKMDAHRKDYEKL